MIICLTKFICILRFLQNEVNSESLKQRVKIMVRQLQRDYKFVEFSERNEGVDCLPYLAFLYLCFAMICGIFLEC